MYLKSWCKPIQYMSLCWSAVYIPVLVTWYTKFKSQRKESVCEKRSDPFGKNHSNIWYLCVLPFYFLIPSHSGVRWTSLLSFHNQVGAFPFSGCCVPLENSPARQKGSQDEGRAGGSPPDEEVGHFLFCKDDWWPVDFKKSGHWSQLLWDSYSECVASAFLISGGLPDRGRVSWLIALQGWIVSEQFLRCLRYKQGFSVICQTSEEKLV